jgi:SAM-dependent methyltransferase
MAGFLLVLKVLHECELEVSVMLGNVTGGLDMTKEHTVGVEAYYTGKSGDRYRSIHLGVADDRIFSAIARQRARKLSPYVGSKDRVFEYGVGSGFNLAALSCGERVGHDLFDGENSFERWGINFCPRTELLSKGYFDVALCMHTLEHVVSPWDVLMEMQRLLRKGGRLIICVPFEIQRSYRHFDPSNIHQHVYSWNPQSLGMLLTKAGFQLDELGVRRFGYDRFTARILMGSSNNLLYRLIHYILLRLRPRYEVMAVCSKRT